MMSEARLDPTDAETGIRWIVTNKSNLNTQKNYLSALIYWAKQNGLEKTGLETYRAKLKEITDELEERAKDQKLSEKEEAKYLTWPKILEGCTKAYDDVSLPDADKLLLAFYTELPPLRLDYANLVVYTEVPPEGTKGNYVVSMKRGSYIRINNHKTFKRYGSIQNNLPASLSRRLRLFLKMNPGTTTLFTMNEQALSKKLQRLFKKYAGKPLGASMLRHSYISHFLSAAPSYRKCQDLAKAMGHSLQLQLYYRRLCVASSDSSSSESESE